MLIQHLGKHWTVCCVGLSRDSYLDEERKEMQIVILAGVEPTVTAILHFN